MKNFLCFFGIHNWVVFKKNEDIKRVCSGCGKRQNLTYDMCYGGSYWQTF